MVSSADEVSYTSGMKWEILKKEKAENSRQIIKTLLKNRGIKTEREEKEFFHPTDPGKIKLKELEISDESVKKAITRNPSRYSFCLCCLTRIEHNYFVFHYFSKFFRNCSDLPRRP